MKICITATSNELNSEMEVRFGRAAYFIIYDTETNNFEAIHNTNIDMASGVGIKSAQLLIDKNVQVVLTGSVGPKATNALNAANIKIVSDLSGKVIDAINNFKENKKEKQSSDLNPNVTSGNLITRGIRRMFGGRNRGRGRGLGIGMGMGMGRRQQGGNFGGPCDYCICPKCHKRVPHQQGVPCRSFTCEDCGVVMVRE